MRLLLFAWLFSITNSNIKGIGLISLLTSGITITLEILSLINHGVEFSINHCSESILVVIQSCCVFLFLKQTCKDKSEISLRFKMICNTSYEVYLIHPFFINVIVQVVENPP